ncbi:ABC transporter substrate-binding protein [Paenibacillus tarimensis]
MKKHIVLLLCMMLVGSLVLAACSQKEENEPEVTPPQVNAPNEDNGENAGDDAEGSEQSEGSGESDQPELGFIEAADPSLMPAASKSRTDTVIIGMNEPQGIFTPWFFNTAFDKYVFDVIFEGLGKVSQDGSIVPSLATWDISEDGKVYTFHIDPKAKFSDGTQVTAEDAEFAFYVYLDPAYDGRGDMMPVGIVGAEAYKDGNAETIEGVKVLDELTLEVTVEEAKAATIYDLSVSVLPKQYYGKDFKKGNLDYVKSLNGKPLGSGPYVFDQFIPGQETRLTANENYWRGAPKVKNLIFKATTDETSAQLIQTGETDFEEGIIVSKDNVELVKGMGFVDISLLLNNGYGYIAVNNKLPKFQDKRVRQALTYGLDRESIVFAYSQGYAQVIDVPESKVSWAYPDESSITHYGYDPEKAKQLLDEAGWEIGSDGYRYKDGEKFTIHFSASTPNPVNDAIIPIATENYKELGIEFIAEQLEFNSVIEKRTKGEHEMAFLAWGLTPDPDPFGTFHTNGGSNWDGYSNPELDKLIEQAQAELDQEKRKQLLSQVYQILNEDVPNIYMYQRYNMNVFNTRLNGFDITPYYDFTESLWEVEIQNQ